MDAQINRLAPEIEPHIGTGRSPYSWPDGLVRGRRRTDAAPRAAGDGELRMIAESTNETAGARRTRPSRRQILGWGAAAGAALAAGRVVAGPAGSALAQPAPKGAGGPLPMSGQAPAELAAFDRVMTEQIDTLAPEIEAYIDTGMKAFDIPGLAVGIVCDDRLAYAKGFGVGTKGGAPVDTKTVFQIGSTTKSFLATTLAIGVDRKLLAWDDHVIDLYPDFQLMDAWVTREFRVFDLLAQRSGLPASANDMVGILGAEQPAMIRSLRYVEPVSSFRSTFAYINIAHMVAQRIVAARFGAASWEAVVDTEIFGPLRMRDSSMTAEAIEAAANHAVGHRWAPDGTVEVPFTPIFPYEFGGAGAINSTVEDMASWLRLQLSGGRFEGAEIVSAENLTVTKTPRIAISDKLSYAMGWVVQTTPHGQIVWHNGGTTSFGAYMGTVLDAGIGVIVLTNANNVGMPDAIGEWILDRLIGNPMVDHLATKLAAAKAGFEATEKVFAGSEARRPSPLPALAAGAYVNPAFGGATATNDGDALEVELTATGATLRLEPWDGGVCTVTLIPEGRFAAVAANLGPSPIGFAQFQANKDGVVDRFRLFLQMDGQGYDFTRA
jgi:CubicO group peptidase (beta-lactamase class C family)